MTLILPLPPVQGGMAERRSGGQDLLLQLARQIRYQYASHFRHHYQTGLSEVKPQNTSNPSGLVIKVVF